MLTLKTVDLFYDVNKCTDTKSLNTSKKATKDITFNSYLDNANSKKNKLISNIDKSIEDNNLDIDSVVDEGNDEDIVVDILGLIGLSNLNVSVDTSSEISLGNVVDVNGESVEDGILNLDNIDVLINQENGLLNEDGLNIDIEDGLNIDIEDGLNIDIIENKIIYGSTNSPLIDSDLDTLSSILEEGTVDKLYISSVEYDYIPNEEVLDIPLLSDFNTLNTNNTNNTNVVDVNVVDNVPTSEYIVRQDMFINDMLSNIDYMSKEGIQRLKLQLSPKDLGDMLVEIVKTSESSKMVITLSKEDLYKVVQNNIKELNAQLSTLNIKVSEVSIELRTDLNNGFLGKEAENRSNEHYNKKGKNSKNLRENKGIEDIVNNSRVVNIIEKDKVILCV